MSLDPEPSPTCSVICGSMVGRRRSPRRWPCHPFAYTSTERALPDREERWVISRRSPPAPRTLCGTCWRRGDSWRRHRKEENVPHEIDGARRRIAGALFIAVTLVACAGGSTSRSAAGASGVPVGANAEFVDTLQNLIGRASLRDTVGGVRISALIGQLPPG